MSVYFYICQSFTMSYPGVCLWVQIRVQFHPSLLLTLSGQRCKSTPPRPLGTPRAQQHASSAWTPAIPWRAMKYWHKTLTGPLKRLQQDKQIQLFGRQTAKLITNWMIKVQRLLINTRCSVFTSSAFSWLHTCLSARMRTDAEALGNVYPIFI